MDWGLLQGLGGGLQQAGKMWDANQKSKLAEKLALEREERAEARQVAREERQAQRAESTVASFSPLRDSDGVTWMQGRNAAGKPIGEKRLADTSEIEEFNRLDQRERLSLEELTSKAEVAKWKASRLGVEAEQDDALFDATLDGKRAQAEADRARAAAAGRRSLDADDDDETFDGAANTLLKKYKDLLETGDDARVSKAEAHSLAREAIEYAIQTNGDTATAEDYFLNAIKSGAKPSKGKVKFVQ